MTPSTIKNTENKTSTAFHSCCRQWFCSITQRIKFKDFLNEKQNKQENVWFSQHKDGKKNVDFKCLKFHLKFIIRKTTTIVVCRSSEPTRQWIGQWIWGIPFMLCVLLGQITMCCANLFQDFPFSLASICTLKLWKRRIDFESESCVAKIGRHLGCYQQTD